MCIYTIDWLLIYCRLLLWIGRVKRAVGPLYPLCSQPKPRGGLQSYESSFLKNLGNLNSSPVLFIHPYEIYLRVLQMCKFDGTWMNDDNNKHWFIYGIFADSSMNKKGFAALKRHVFSPANILCWTKKNEECDSHMMSPETWGCCQRKWSDTNKCCF